MPTSVGLPAVSVTVTVALAVFASGRIRRANDHTRDGNDHKPRRQDPWRCIRQHRLSLVLGSAVSATPTVSEPGAV